MAYSTKIYSENDINKILRYFGIKYFQAGEELQGHCPWHNDKNPSFGVNIKKSTFNCFSCGRGGTISQLCWQLGNQSADSILGQPNTWTAFGAHRMIGNVNSIRTEYNLTKIGHMMKWSDNEVCKKYILEKRGIAGWVADELNFQYTDALIINGRPFEKRLMIECKNEDGITTTWEGRDVTGRSDTDKEYKKCLYPTNSSSNILFNFQNIDLYDYVYVTEGIMDLVKVYEHTKNVVSTFGCVIKSQQVKLMELIANKKMVIIPDNDASALKALHELDEVYSNDFYVLPVPPWYKDVGDMPSSVIKAWLNPTNYVEVKRYLKGK